MTERTCLDCDISLKGMHRNQKRCKPCAVIANKRATQKSKGIVLAQDAIKCPVCGELFNTITAGHFRKHGYKTATEFKEIFDLPTLKAPSICRKQSEFMEKNSPTKGKARSTADLELMSKNRKGKGLGRSGTYERTPEIRKKISQGVTKAYIEGRAGRGDVAWSTKMYKHFWIRSTWEERVVHVLDIHPCVLSFEVEPFRIPYLYEGVERIYIPDFLVVLEGNIRELWEVKPRELLRLPRNRAKIKALNGFKGVDNKRIVTLKDLEQMEMQVHLRPWEGPGEPWVRLDDPWHRPTC